MDEVTQEKDADELAILIDPEEEKRLARQKKKQVYISLHNPDKPDKIEIGGVELGLAGINYLIVEIHGGRYPKYITGNLPVDISITGATRIPEELQDIQVKGEETESDGTTQD